MGCAQSGQGTNASAGATLTVDDDEHEGIEEGIIDVRPKPNESQETFSLRAFGINDGNWLIQVRRHEMTLLKLRQATLGETSDLRALLQANRLAHHWPTLKQSNVVALGQQELLPALLTGGLPKLSSNLEAAGLAPPVAVSVGKLIASVQRPRILCFHGMSCSGEILRSMIRPLMLQLPADYVFVDGQHTRASLSPEKPTLKCLTAGWPESPQLMYTQKRPPHGISKPGDAATYYELEAAIDYCCAQCKALGPFDAVLGYNQGSHMQASPNRQKAMQTGPLMRTVMAGKRACWLFAKTD